MDTTMKTNKVYAVEYINDLTNNRRTIALFNEFADAKAFAEKKYPTAGAWYSVGDSHIASINENQAICVYTFPVY